jgi:hypothetical protein
VPAKLRTLAAEPVAHDVSRVSAGSSAPGLHKPAVVPPVAAGPRRQLHGCAARAAATRSGAFACRRRAPWMGTTGTLDCGAGRARVGATPLGEGSLRRLHDPGPRRAGSGPSPERSLTTCIASSNLFGEDDGPDVPPTRDSGPDLAGTFRRRRREDRSGRHPDAGLREPRMRQGGRVSATRERCRSLVDRGALLRRCGPQGSPWVQIPPSPLRRPPAAGVVTVP